MIEKRRHRRLDVDIPAVLRCGGRLIPAVVLNLSSGGMRIKAEGGGISENQPFEVVFDLSKERRDISMRGRIVWADPSPSFTYVGARFTNPFSTGHEAIEEHIKR